MVPSRKGTIMSVSTDPPSLPFPNPFDTSSTGPYAGPPDTWEVLASQDDARQAAAGMGELHNATVRSLLDLRAQYGGGLRGMTLGILQILQARTAITAADAARLEAVIEAVLHTTDHDATVSDTAKAKVASLRQEIMDDQGSSLAAIAISSVALSSMQMWTDQVTFDAYTDGVHEGAAIIAADVAGAMIGSVAGAIGVLAGEAAASTLVATTETSVTISYG
jgi:hypothetical protein